MRYLLTAYFTDGTSVSDTYTDPDQMHRTINFVLQGCTVDRVEIKAL